jgi:hypothetical protein
MSPSFNFFDDETQTHKTFCKICFYEVGTDGSDDEISQLNLTAGYMNE